MSVSGQLRKQESGMFTASKTPVDRLEVLTVSDMCVDLVLTGNVHPQFHQIEQIVDNYALEIGGSANIFASQLAKLGARVGVVGRIGEDAFGEFALCRLQASGVDTSRVKHDSTSKTGVGVALAEPDDRAILTYLGTIDSVQPSDLPSAVSAAYRHWHIASYFLLRRLCSFWIEWAQRCKEAGVTLSLDTNWDPENRWEGVNELLPFIDVLLPNENEAIALTGEIDFLKAARRLAAYGPLVVVKLGKKGAIAVRGDQVFELNASEVESGPVKVADSVGAGDNFDAGFIRAWLLGRSISECLSLAHRCAVASLAKPGGIEGQLREPVR